MSEVKPGDRPLSPHLTIYKPELNMVMSIVHRMTGVGLAAGAVLVSWWFLAAATSEHYYAFADWALTSWVGTLVLLGCVWALWYHFCNGLRHLIWDVGLLFDNANVEKAGYAVLALSLLLTLATIFLA